MFKDVEAFSGFSVNNLETAKAFYGEMLGLSVDKNPVGLTIHLASGAEIFVYPKPNHVPATFTILNFKVADIDRTVDDLTKKGVKFEHYNQGEMKTDEKGIARSEGTVIAWFKDPAGNFLSVIQK